MVEEDFTQEVAKDNQDKVPVIDQNIAQEVPAKTKTATVNEEKFKINIKMNAKAFRMKAAKLKRSNRYP